MRRGTPGRVERLGVVRRKLEVPLLGVQRIDRIARYMGEAGAIALFPEFGLLRKWRFSKVNQ